MKYKFFVKMRYPGSLSLIQFLHLLKILEVMYSVVYWCMLGSSVALDNNQALSLLLCLGLEKVITKSKLSMKSISVVSVIYT